ncbi:uncharacterized protein [Sagmatias obliquidens]|uniref:uncharacterized protein n=1 Tax=Sagmatias obliquidens TaxID=3371155 RepID=UPI000F445584|nr:uncharacterized protein LOC113607274 [Lagenorhynchus obliquidens]
MMSAGPERRPCGGGDGAEDAARPSARPSPGPGPGSLAPSPGSPAAAAAQPPANLWLELGPACSRAQQCPSESSGQTSGDLGTSSSSGGGSSAGLSPGSDSDSSGVVCGGRGGSGGMRGALSRSWSLESLRSATAGKGAAVTPRAAAPCVCPSRAPSLHPSRDGLSSCPFLLHFFCCLFPSFGSWLPIALLFRFLLSFRVFFRFPTTPVPFSPTSTCYSRALVGPLPPRSRARPQLGN